MNVILAAHENAPPVAPLDHCANHSHGNHKRQRCQGNGDGYAQREPRPRLLWRLRSLVGVWFHARILCRQLGLVRSGPGPAMNLAESISRRDEWAAVIACGFWRNRRAIGHVRLRRGGRTAPALRLACKATRRELDRAEELLVLGLHIGCQHDARRFVVLDHPAIGGVLAGVLLVDASNLVKTGRPARRIARTGRSHRGSIQIGTRSDSGSTPASGRDQTDGGTGRVAGQRELARADKPRRAIPIRASCCRPIGAQGLGQTSALCRSHSPSCKETQRASHRGLCIANRSSPTGGSRLAFPISGAPQLPPVPPQFRRLTTAAKHSSGRDRSNTAPARLQQTRLATRP